MVTETLVVDGWWWTVIAVGEGVCAISAETKRGFDHLATPPSGCSASSLGHRRCPHGASLVIPLFRQNGTHSRTPSIVPRT
jgi:hypothetical protein